MGQQHGFETGGPAVDSFMLGGDEVHKEETWGNFHFHIVGFFKSVLRVCFPGLSTGLPLSSWRVFSCIATAKALSLSTCAHGVSPSPLVDAGWRKSQLPGTRSVLLPEGPGRTASRHVIQPTGPLCVHLSLNPVPQRM